jgi:hypothetical protein
MFVFLFCMFCFLFCVFCVFVLFYVLLLSMHIVVYFLFVYNFTHCYHRLETQLQLINIISYHIISFPPLEVPGATEYAHLRLFGQDLPLIRIFVQHPNAEWTTVWENIASTSLSDETRSTWYRVIHDLIPKQVRLHEINIHHMYVQCNDIYTLLHRHNVHCHLRAVAMDTSQDCCHTSTVTRYVPSQWLLLPNITFWPKTKRQTKIWLTRHYVHYVVRNGSSVTQHDYMDFLPCALKKLKR